MKLKKWDDFKNRRAVVIKEYMNVKRKQWAVEAVLHLYC